MKIVNTDDLRRIIEEDVVDFRDIFGNKDEISGPCREVKIEDSKITLLVDKKELMCQTFEKLNIKEISMEYIDNIMLLWRCGNIVDLKKYLHIE